MTEVSYIYIRTNIFYDEFNICLLGNTVNIYETNLLFNSMELVKGQFYSIYAVENELMNKIFSEIKEYFQELNVYSGSSSELYNIGLLNELDLFFTNSGYSFIKLTHDEINLITEGN
jgi:hypothetical protein